jgi:UDP-N-acetylglucosamine 2-epimerase (non-hydrolysing)
MKKLNVLVVIGTRPEIIRLSRVLAKLDLHCNLVIAHTGQNYDFELNEIFFNELGVRTPDYFLNAAGINGSQTIGNVIIQIDNLLDEIKPDAVLVLGDTNSGMAVIPAKRRKIPTFHMEAGNRCFDMRVPEEINRKIIDHTADINLPYSGIAREYLLNEGLAPDQIIKTGSPLFEVLYHHLKDIHESSILESLNLSEGKFFLVSAHREENINSPANFQKLTHLLNMLAITYQAPVIVSTHPRTQKMIDRSGVVFNPLVKLLKPLGFFDYNKLQLSAKAVLSDSGSISEESSILNFPALNLREAHERPEAMEEAAVMMVGLESERVLQAIEILASQNQSNKNFLRPVEDYNSPNVSEKIVRIIHSYTDYVNRIVWKKY